MGQMCSFSKIHFYVVMLLLVTSHFLSDSILLFETDVAQASFWVYPESNWGSGCDGKREAPPRKHLSNIRLNRPRPVVQSSV